MELGKQIQTYREIVAFSEGKTLSDIEKAREEGKRPYQSVMKVVLSGVVGFVGAAFMAWIINLIF